jgi:predicted GIY-YIG superfamily endonuclease
MTWYCYILAHGERTYNGSTNDPRRRLRQHNGELKGGARATSRAGPGWRFVAVVAGFPDHVNALQCEWRIKCPSGVPGKRGREWQGPAGRIRGLGHVLRLKQWTKQTTVSCGSYPLQVWIEERYAQELYVEGELPAYVRTHVVRGPLDHLQMFLPMAETVVPKIDVGLFSNLETDVPNMDSDVNPQHPMFPTSDLESESEQESESGINITFV